MPRNPRWPARGIPARLTFSSGSAGWIRRRCSDGKGSFVSGGRHPDQADACRRSDGGVTHLGDRDATRPERDGVCGPNARAPDASLQRERGRGDRAILPNALAFPRPIRERTRTDHRKGQSRAGVGRHSTPRQRQTSPCLLVLAPASAAREGNLHGVCRTRREKRRSSEDRGAQILRTETESTQLSRAAGPALRNVFSALPRSEGPANAR
jgi:hypothetical protein